MESVSGVDVSWLHHQAAQKDKHRAPSKTPSKQSSKASSRAPSPPPELPKPSSDSHPQVPLRHATPPPPTSAPIPIASTPNQKSTPKRGGLLNRPSSEKLSGSSVGSGPEETKSSGRTGWIRNLSSKFSSQEKSATLSQTGSSPALQVSPPQPKPPLPANALSPPPDRSRPSEEHEPYVPQAPKSGGSFFSSALRRLSSSAPNAPSKPATQGSTCPRRLLNVDTKRERCKVSDLKGSSLRRVAFSVDVEVAGVSRYIDESEPAEPATMAKDKKIQARSEGEALKNPALFAEKKETASSIVNGPAEPRQNSIGSVDELLENEMLAAAKKQEQEAAMKRRHAREEKRRRRAQEAEVGVSSRTAISPDPKNASTDLDRTPVSAHPEDQPTTDPLRIYRRCCQLREAPVLKRISEQLANMKQEVENTGYVSLLDLNGSRLQLADIGCLGDWLAVVPLKRLLMDNANLTDEGLRIVLSGLLATKPPDPSKTKSLRPSTPQIQESRQRRRHGVIEKISLRLNHKITADGWKYVCLFLNLSPSLRAIDLSLVPFPHLSGPNSHDTTSLDIASILHESLSKRPKDFPHLEEFIVSECHLTTHDVGQVVDAACAAGVSKLGLAKNNMDREAIEHVQRFLASKGCGGLDLGGNDLRDNLAILAKAIKGSTLWALCLADCNLDPKALATLFPSLLTLSSFRILVLSHNRGLFGPSHGSVGILRKYLPMCTRLRRLDLTDVALSPQQAIAIADILPEVRNLGHISFVENTEIRRLSTASDAVSQEEACALYGSLTVAVRISKTLLVVDIEVPSKETSDIVQALAKQVVAYSFRNIERFTAVDAINHDDPASVVPDSVEPEKEVPIPEVLEHLLGSVEDDGNHASGNSIPADHDYIVGGTGVVKALSYVLGQKSSEIRRMSGHFSGASSPSHPGTPASEDQKARDMSLSLLNSARKIRGRLQAAMAQETNSADELTYRRLQFLDNALQGMIERFENEFPDSAVPTNKAVLQYPFRPHAAPAPDNLAPAAAHDPDAAEAVDVEPSPPRSRASSNTSSIPSTGSAVSSASKTLPPKEKEGIMEVGPTIHSSSRRGSTASLAAKAQAHEEGRMHRFGQRFRREILPPKGVDDHLHRTSRTDLAEAPHLAELRRRLEAVDSEHLREKVIKNGLESTVREYSKQAEDLRRDSMPVLGGSDVVFRPPFNSPENSGGRQDALSSLEGKSDGA